MGANKIYINSGQNEEENKLRTVLPYVKGRTDRVDPIFAEIQHHADDSEDFTA